MNYLKLLILVLFTATISFNAPEIKAEQVSSSNFRNSNFVFPILSPRISSHYGKRKHPTLKKIRHHSGIDLAVPPGSHVRTVAAGVVIYADKNGAYGKLVTVKHEGGYTSLYAHLSELGVNPGQKVDAGQVIGRVGSTGRSTGPHLHFEWRKNGQPLDPIKHFPSLGEKAEG